MAYSLLERLKGPSRHPDRQVPSAGDVRESVCEHLRRLLNSRLDMADACPDYGLREPAEIVRNLPDSRGSIEEEIRRCIEKYEPRLTDVRVSQLDAPGDPLAVSFRIAARLQSDRTEEQVWFETVVAASGRIKVQIR